MHVYLLSSMCCVLSHSQEAVAGSSTLTLVEAVDWRVGDEIAVSPTEYDVSQLETAFITAVSSDGLTLTLDRPLAHTHAGQQLTVTEWGPRNSEGGGDDTVLLSAAVGLLTRNVRIEGAVIDTSVGTNYGAHMVVGDIVRDSVLFSGTVNLTYVQLHHFGKQNMEHAGLSFNYQDDSNGVNLIAGCAFSHSLNYAVAAQKVVGMRLLDNVFHRTYRTSVRVDPTVSHGC
jgi:hypothetical protein